MTRRALQNRADRPRCRDGPSKSGLAAKENQKRNQRAEHKQNGGARDVFGGHDHATLRCRKGNTRRDLQNSKNTHFTKFIMKQRRF
jgi:hypothetical protein